LQKAGKKPNKLNSCPFQIGARQLAGKFAHLTAVQSKAQACGSKVYLIQKVYIYNCDYF